MIRIHIVFIALILFCGCSGSIARKDKAELATEAAVKAGKLAKAGDTKEASEVLLKALSKDSTLARLQLELAIILHESEKDYLGAAYHYRQYLKLRPETQKRELIVDRLRVTKQLLAAGVVGTENVTSVSLEQLEKQNADLVSRNRVLEEELRQARSIARQSMGSRQASNRVSGASEADSGSDRTGFRHYTVKRGDSLSTIAVKMYKDANMWDQIYEANRRELENSNDLKIGQVLVIPKEA